MMGLSIVNMHERNIELVLFQNETADYSTKFFQEFVSELD